MRVNDKEFEKRTAQNSLFRKSYAKCWRKRIG